MKNGGSAHDPSNVTRPASPDQAAGLKFGLLIGGLLLTSLVYAVIRYNVFGGVSSDQIPLYVTNKAISITSLALIAIAFSARRISLNGRSRLGWVRTSRRPIGMMGLYLALLHSVISLMLLNPQYFAKFYTTSGKMNAAAEASMLTGTIALVLMFVQSQIKAVREQPGKLNQPQDQKYSHARRQLRHLGFIVLLLTAAHVTLMGWPGWLAIDDWPGKLPPITLLSLIVAVAGLALGLMPKR